MKLYKICMFTFSTMMMMKKMMQIMNPTPQLHLLLSTVSMNTMVTVDMRRSLNLMMRRRH